MKTGKLRDAFSLIEVTMALGIASFGLLAIGGLLPVGLGSMKDSRDEAAAAKCLEQMAIAIRGATLGADGAYHSSGGFADLSWTDGEVVQPPLYTDISLGGFRTTDSINQRLTARVEIIAPQGATPGKALISVAWPNRATWNTADRKWTKASGSVSTWLTLIPQ